MNHEEPSTTAKVISAVTVGLVVVLLVLLANTLVSVVALFQIRDQTEQNENVSKDIHDQAEQNELQSVKNQLHIDCIIALGAQTEPPQCADVWEQLYADGFLPRPVPTTTTP